MGRLTVLTVFGTRPEAIKMAPVVQQLRRHAQQVAARVLLGLDPLLADLRPDWVLVQGDTTTVMAAAIAAHHRRVRVGHVEAGLRTCDRANPFPEEMNRVLADHVSDLHCAPTGRACQNLLREGIPEASIRITGNTVIDALLQVANRPWEPPQDDPLPRLDGQKRGRDLLPGRGAGARG